MTGQTIAKVLGSGDSVESFQKSSMSRPGLPKPEDFGLVVSEGQIPWTKLKEYSKAFLVSKRDVHSNGRNLYLDNLLDCDALEKFGVPVGGYWDGAESKESIYELPEHILQQLDGRKVAPGVPIFFLHEGKIRLLTDVGYIADGDVLDFNSIGYINYIDADLIDFSR